MKRFVDGMAYPPDERHFVWIGSLAQATQERLCPLTSAPPPPVTTFFEDVARYPRPLHPARRYPRPALVPVLEALYMQDCHPGEGGPRHDGPRPRGPRPFLDHRVVERSAPCRRWKLRGLTMKYLLKRMLRGKVPDAVIDRPRRASGMPIAEWRRVPSARSPRISSPRTPSAATASSARRRPRPHRRRRRPRRLPQGALEPPHLPALAAPLRRRRG
ncbi:MAG: asparagine synthase C-terminal domain-containing protein [Gammaproteobacteria bacterium]|nr:asparagine synthase C-terminal domain-containing protein [Gammaproteobacteria bacterium]